MSAVITVTDLPEHFGARELAELAAPFQQRPDRFQAYFGDVVDEIETEIDEIPDWRPHTSVALDGERLVGWLIAEHDDEVGRVWWWGPVVDEPADWADVAGHLLDHASEQLAGRFEQFEFAVGAEHDAAIVLAEQRGHRRDIGSVILEVTGIDERPSVEPPAGVSIGPLTDDVAGRIAELHDEVFPGSHMTGRQLVDARDDVVVVASAAGTAIGYLRAEIQAGGAGYIDFLGVDEHRRSGGIGGALVEAALAELARRGAGSASLTVREDNAPARALYDRLGFDGSRILVPLRSGF